MARVGLENVGKAVIQAGGRPDAVNGLLSNLPTDSEKRW